MTRHDLSVPGGVAVLLLVLASTPMTDVPAAGAPPDPAQRSATPRRSEVRSQPRPHGQRVLVDPALVGIDDGDSLTIRWAPGDTEAVRILGIDTPEIRHVDHDIPYAQPFGPEARAFALGVFVIATRVELLRSSTLDPYGRTLGYVFVNGLNYSVLAVRARLAQENVSHFGDNGLPKEAAEVLAAAKLAGPSPFEPPYRYRARMRDLSVWMRAQGVYPEE